MVRKDLVRRSEAQDLARPVIKTVGNMLDIGVGNGAEVSFLWKILADEAVSVLFVPRCQDE